MDVERRVLDGPAAADDVPVEVDHHEIARPHFRPVQAERRQQKPIAPARHQQRQVVVDALVQTEVRGQSMTRGQIDPRLPLCVRRRGDGFGTGTHVSGLGRSGARSIAWIDIRSSHCRPRIAPLQTIDLVYFNAGGGHRSAALALDSVIREQARPWQVRLVNLMEVLDPESRFHKTLGMYPEDLYNTRLARGWSLGLAQELKFLQALIRLCHQGMTNRLRRHWRRTQPDLVVSLIPNFNRTLCEALAGARPGAPYVTLMTDFADLPPHFWIEPGQSQHFICGTPKAVAQARAMGYGPSQVHATSGMIVRPDFYRGACVNRREAIAQL